MSDGSRNLAWADAFIAALTAAGLEHLVLSPGARSAPLALAALRRTELHCHVINDERAAGFFALGLGRETARPAALLCTSGTASANYLPAVMEANLAAVPLLILTADRPPALLGWGANQTVDQSGLYARQVRLEVHLPAGTELQQLGLQAVRLLECCRAPLPGPVHVNLPFAEPLLPPTLPAPPPLPAVPRLLAPSAAPLPELDELAAALSAAPGVLLCGELREGPDFAPAIAALAAQLAAPILAEPLSGLRHGAHDRSHILSRQARFLGTAPLPEPAWILRFGRFPLSRSLERWLAGCHRARQLLVAPSGPWPDPIWRSDTLIRAAPTALVRALRERVRPAAADWLPQWLEAEQAAASPPATPNAALNEREVVRILLANLPENSRCFIGNSLAIRTLDLESGTSARALHLHGNRGASGIDGNIATAAGIAAECEARITSPLALLIGDQTALHDCSSLALLAGRPAIVVVLDNRGGGIFSRLPWAAAVPPALLARGWTAPTSVDFAALATAFGLRPASAGTPDEFQTALQTALAGGSWLIQARLVPEQD